MRFWEKEPLTEDQKALVEEHFKYVLITAKKMTPHGCSEVYREKLYDGALDGLLCAVATFDPARGMIFKSYAFNKMKFGVLDAIRSMIRSKRRGFGKTISLDHPDCLDLSGSADHVRDMLNAERIGALRRTIEKLPDYQRKPLILRCFHHMDSDTIADLLHSTRGNIDVSISHAKRTIRGDGRKAG